MGKRVVILGGGLVGCETAVALRGEGHEVTVIEMTDQIAAGANPRYLPMLLDALRESGAAVMTGARMEKITPASVFVRTSEGTREIACDSVMLAAGTRGLDDEARRLGAAARSFATAGDCAGAGNVHKSTLRGFFAARDI